MNTLGISLDHDDRRHIDEIYFTGTPLDGDCFELERHASRHRDIMKFNLNTPQ
ncbi:MAG TPA: hypothetical protein PK765_00660 [bacterium]|nr:hypothetical protein [bacterium]